MRVTYVFALLITCSIFPASNVARGEEYVLRLEDIGYEDVPTSGDTEDRVLRRIEVVVRPGSRFLAKARLGREQISITGKVRRLENDTFSVRYAFSHSTAADEKDLPPARRSGESTVELRLGKRIHLGGLTGTSGPPGRETRSKCDTFLSIDPYEPEPEAD